MLKYKESIIKFPMISQEVMIIQNGYTKNVTELELEDSQLQDYQKECEICLDNFSNNNLIINMPKCKHVYHWECLKDWIKFRPNCPNCRSNLRFNLLTDLYHQSQVNYQDTGNDD